MDTKRAHWATFAFAMSMIPIVVVAFVSFIYSPYLIFNTHLSKTLTPLTVGHGIILFALFPFEIPVNISLGALFVSLWTIYVIIFAIGLNGPYKSITCALRQTAKEGVDAIFQNSMLAVFVTFSPLFWLTYLITEVESIGGIHTGSISQVNSFLLLLELTIAPLREEIGFRVVPIGVVALLILFSRKRYKDGILALWHPSRYLKKNDTPDRYKTDLKPIAATVILSSLIFGSEHYLLGGWGPGKILSASVAGFALAFLYYELGLPASILLHLAFDFFLVVYYIGGESQVYNYVTMATMVLAIPGAIACLIFVRRKYAYFKLLGRNVSHPVSARAEGTPSLPAIPKPLT